MYTFFLLHGQNKSEFHTSFARIQRHSETLLNYKNLFFSINERPKRIYAQVPCNVIIPKRVDFEVLSLYYSLSSSGLLSYLHACQSSFSLPYEQNVALLRIMKRFLLRSYKKCQRGVYHKPNTPTKMTTHTRAHTNKQIKTRTKVTHVRI